MSLTFDAAEHAYHLDGRRLPSVTQILEDVGIIDYSGIPGASREQYLLRGQIVHACTQFDDEMSVEGNRLADDQIDPRVAGYVEAWRRFRRDTGFTPELIEHRAANKQYGFAGTLDRTGRLRGETGVGLWDIKTGHAMPWTRLQLAAYASFFEKPRTLLRSVVELHEDGTYCVPFVWQARDWMTDFNIFLSAVNVFREKHPNFGLEKRRAA